MRTLATAPDFEIGQRIAVQSKPADDSYLLGVYTGFKGGRLQIALDSQLESNRYKPVGIDINGLNVYPVKNIGHAHSLPFKALDITTQPWGKVLLGKSILDRRVSQPWAFGVWTYVNFYGFQGKLKPIRLQPMPSLRPAGVCTKKYIGFATNKPITIKGFTTVVAHEMIHQWQFEHHRRVRHNHRFERWAKILSRKLGLKITSLVDVNDEDMFPQTKLVPDIGIPTINYLISKVASRYYAGYFETATNSQLNHLIYLLKHINERNKAKGIYVVSSRDEAPIPYTPLIDLNHIQKGVPLKEIPKFVYDYITSLDGDAAWSE